MCPMSELTRRFGTSAVMLTVGMLACIAPARRALSIQPIDALKES